MTKVKFTETYTVDRGDGVPAHKRHGPTYHAGKVYDLEDKVAEFWMNAGKAVPATAADDPPAEEAGPTSIDGLENFNVNKLTALAQNEKVNIDDCKTKGDIVKAIRAARAASETK